MKVYTCRHGINAELIAEAATLYIDDGDTVADVTYGKGAFWVDKEPERFTLLKSDKMPRSDDITEMDLTRLDYEDKSIDVLVLDPPYMHTPGKAKGGPMVNKNYMNSETTFGQYHGDIMANLYFKGMAEARRVLVHKGRLLVKCQDEIQSGKQVWSHIEIYNAALAMGFYAKDMFVLMRNDKPPVTAKQQHARRNHSYLWVFQREAR